MCVLCTVQCTETELTETVASHSLNGDGLFSFCRFAVLLRETIPHNYIKHAYRSWKRKAEQERKRENARERIETHGLENGMKEKSRDGTRLNWVERDGNVYVCVLCVYATTRKIGVPYLVRQPHAKSLINYFDNINCEEHIFSLFVFRPNRRRPTTGNRQRQCKFNEWSILSNYMLPRWWTRPQEIALSLSLFFVPFLFFLVHSKRAFIKLV